MGMDVEQKVVLTLTCDREECEASETFTGTLNQSSLETQASDEGWMIRRTARFGLRVICPECSKTFHQILKIFNFTVD